jgi:hypothetical protein
LLTAYASIAILWTPVPIPALKLVGNMAGIILSLVVLEKASRRDFLDSRAVIVLVVVSLTLGIVQTYYYGGASYGFDGLDQPSRFSSFVAAQQYAAFLVGFLAILLWHRRIVSPVRVALCVGVLGALLLNGSRVWFFGAAIVLVIYSWNTIRRIVAITAFAAVSVGLLMVLLANINLFHGIELNDSSNRIAATANALLTGTDTLHNVGLRDLNFRSRIYEGVFKELSESSILEIAFGHGTSTGGAAMLREFPGNYRPDAIDPNRMIHNEWLRTAYEWGVIGLLLLGTSVGTILVGLMGKLQRAQVKERIFPALSFLPAFIAALSTENTLAGAGNAVTMSFALTVAFSWGPVVYSGLAPVRSSLVGTNRDSH